MATKRVPTLKPLIGVCEICGKGTEWRCGRCLKAFYCCRDHQLVHWKRHRAECVPAAQGAGADTSQDEEDIEVSVRRGGIHDAARH